MEIREEVMTEEEQMPEAKEGGIDIEVLAEIVATKVVEMLNAPAEKKAEETTEEETTEEETKPEVEEETETEAQTEEEEETENRAIDYSAFESRLAKL